MFQIVIENLQRYISFLFNTSLTDLPVTNSKIEDLTTQHNHTEQEDEAIQQEVTSPATGVKQDSRSNLDSDWEFLDAMDSTGTRHIIKVIDKTDTITSTVMPYSDQKSGSELYVLVRHLRLYQYGRACQERLEEFKALRHLNV